MVHRFTRIVVWAGYLVFSAAIVVLVWQFHPNPVLASCVAGTLIALPLLRGWLAANESSNISGGIDDALEDPRDDCLERARFVERIFRIVDGTPVDAHIRIGIYGAWGDGKTSVLNFLVAHCRQAGHPVAFFNPWQFRTRDDAWKGFVASLDKGIATWQRMPIGHLEWRNWLASASKYVRLVAESFEVPLANQLAGLLLAPLEGLLEETKARVETHLSRILGDKRLYIFIDDLDRATPDVVYEFLMLLNEVIDLNRCIYIIGLDKKETACLIKSRTGLEGGEAFLEKIINWPFELPVPSDIEWRQLLEKEVSGRGAVKLEALKSMFEHLPRSPRKLKHFVRYLDSLHRGFLDRFDEDELSWSFLYLAQLLRFEFPDLFRLVATDPLVVNNIPGNDISDHLLQERNRTRKTEDLEKPEWEQAIDRVTKDLAQEKRARFNAVFKAMRSAGSMLEESSVRTHLLVVEAPELLTWKEYRIFKNKLVRLGDKEILKRLAIFFRHGQAERTLETQREFMMMLMRERQQLLSQISDVTTEAEQQELMHSVHEIMRICDLVLDVEGLFHGIQPIFDASIFREWYTYLQRWAHFREPQAVYVSIRGAEGALAIKMAQRVSGNSSLVLDKIRPLFRRGTLTEVDKAFLPTHIRIKELLDAALVEEMIDRFERPGGIHSLWGQTEFLAEKDLLFKQDSLFHTERVYERLRTLAMRAKKEKHIQINFVEYVQMLFYSATDHAVWGNQSDVLELLRKRGLLEIVWPAVVAQPLNGRNVGDMEGSRKKILAKLFGGDENVLPTPEWWRAILAGFEKRETDSKPEDSTT